jgi:DNA invertase Pin-like site-specific DNA recombinase
VDLNRPFLIQISVDSWSAQPQYDHPVMQLTKQSRSFAEAKTEERRMKAAIYCRISKEELNIDNQALELRAYAARAGHEITAEFTDVETGSHADREGLNALLDAASRKDFEVVLFVRLDRITRLGAYHAHAFFHRLDAYGVSYKSLNDPCLDSNIPMVRDIVITVMASHARQERETLISRTKAGLVRARAEGKTLGRPRVLGSKGHVGDLQEIKKLHKAGKSQRQIAVDLGLSKGTVQRALDNL